MGWVGFLDGYSTVAAKDSDSSATQSNNCRRLGASSTFVAKLYFLFLDRVKVKIDPRQGVCLGLNA